MFGLSLIHAGFLAAAAAIAVPILIHLLMRPRARQVSIGTLRFLKLALQETTRRRKVRRWLLLALRVAAVLLLALLFARPYFSSTGELGKDREVIVLVDQSGSMGATFSGRTLFSNAQERAKNILADLPEGTKAHLAYFDNRVWESTEGDSPIFAAQKSGQSPRKPGYAGTDFGQALCWARDVFMTSKREHKKIHLLTDLHRTGQHAPCKNFPADAEVEIVELGKPLIGNLAVEKAEAAQPTIRAQEPIVVSAQVSNAGVMPAHDVQVRLRLESRGSRPIEQTKTVSIAAAGTEKIEFSMPITQQGFYQGSVEVLANDGFPIDDRRFLAFEARAADRILLIDGEPGSSIFSNETYYLEMALRLALPGKGSPLSPYEPERLALVEGARLPDLSSYSVVVLCNAAGLGEDDLARLRTFVDWGNRLVIFTGEKVQPAAYVPLDKVGLLPGMVEGAPLSGLFRFQSWDKDHPIFRQLSDPQQGDLRRLAFRKISRVKPAADAKILASVTGGKPLLLEKALGRGTALLFATAADREWGDWPQARLYVPLVHQIVGYLTDRLPENQRVRGEIAGPGADMPPGVTSDKNMITVRNIDARESRIERYSEKQFRGEFQLAGAKIAGAPKQALASVMPLGAERPSEIWSTVILILLAVLALEVFVANRTHA